MGGRAEAQGRGALAAIRQTMRRARRCAHASRGLGENRVHKGDEATDNVSGRRWRHEMRLADTVFNVLIFLKLLRDPTTL